MLLTCTFATNIYILIRFIPSKLTTSFKTLLLGSLNAGRYSCLCELSARSAGNASRLIRLGVGVKHEIEPDDQEYTLKSALFPQIWQSKVKGSFI
jgi:hypothetical protein